MRKINFTFLLSILLSMVGSSAFAYDAEVDGIYYNFSSGKAKVTYYSETTTNADAYKGNIVIPESVTYNGNTYSVTSIGVDAFMGCTDLISIKIPNSVTEIYGSAFQGCSNLTSIDIPNSVTHINGLVFKDCRGLISATIPNSVTSIGTSAFEGCSSLTSVTIPSGVTKIDASAFQGCSGLESIIVENGNNIYDSRDNCNAIINTKENELVLGCKKSTIPDNVTTIGPLAFYNCTDLTSIKIPNSVTRIRDKAFYNCCRLTSVIFPNSVTEIGGSSFQGCSGLTIVTIPSSVTLIYGSAFWNCNGLESIIVENGNNIYDSRDNCNAIINTKENELVLGCKKSTIPNSVTSIGNYAFYECSGLTSVTIPSGITKIDASAFRGCSGLESIIVENGNNIYDSRDNCNAIINTKENELVLGCKKSTIPNSVTSIGNYAFYECSNLTSIDIPNSVNSICSKAFSGCPKLIVFCNRQTPPSAKDDTFETGQLGIVPLDIAEAYRTAIGWRNLFINDAFIAEDITQTTVTLATSEKFSNTSVIFGDQEFTAVDGKVMITGLKPNREYSFSAFAKYDGIDLENTITVQTKTVSLSYNVDRTNLTATLKGSYDAGDATVTKHGFVNMSDNVDEVTLNGLIPGRSYTRTYYVECGENCIFTKEISFSTIPIDVAINETHGVTTCTLNGSYSVIDATVTGYGFTDSPSIKKITRTGLDPNTFYSYTFYVETKEGGRITKSVSFRTSPLFLTTQQPKVVSLGNVIVSAEANIDDEEKNVGFEWRRTDWTDDFASNTGTANMVEGTMEGYIRNLNTEKLWKFRPYYLSDSGTYYYGEWIGLDPTNTSYFEPTVHTYAKIEVKGNTALVKGYALGGSDEVTVQGFKYWKNAGGGSNRVSSTDIPDNAKTIEASGTVMEVSLSDLDYDSSYNYVAFATTSKGTYYGEIKTFETGNAPTGINTIKIDNTSTENVHEIARFNMQGRRIETPEKGINIVKMSDGTTRKIFVK